MAGDNVIRDNLIMTERVNMKKRMGNDRKEFRLTRVSAVPMIVTDGELVPLLCTATISQPL